MGENTRDPRIQEHVHTHHLADDQFDTLVNLLVAVVAPDPVPAPPAEAPATPYDLGLEPWTFHDPAGKCDVMAYLDDRNQVRHVPTSRTTEVPPKWRRIWIEPER